MFIPFDERETESIEVLGLKAKSEFISGAGWSAVIDNIWNAPFIVANNAAWDLTIYNSWLFYLVSF